MREGKRMVFDTVTGLCCQIKPKHMVLSAVIGPFIGLGGQQTPTLALNGRKDIHLCKLWVPPWLQILKWTGLRPTRDLCLPVCPPSCRVKKYRCIFYLIDTWFPYQVTLKSSGTPKRAESEWHSVKHVSKVYEGSSSASCSFICLLPA